jgi:hypothetical protein
MSTYQTGLGIEQLEIFQGIDDGWYYGFCQPGCLFDSEPIGPFDTEDEAKQNAIDTFDLDLDLD